MTHCILFYTIVEDNYENQHQLFQLSCSNTSTVVGCRTLTIILKSYHMPQDLEMK